MVKKSFATYIGILIIIIDQITKYIARSNLELNHRFEEPILSIPADKNPRSHHS